MKHNFLLILLSCSAFANINNISSFEADFKQSIVDDQNKTIIYNGHIQAQKPQYALWKYTNPIQKSVYILLNKVVMVEPDLEQAIIKNIDSNFDFFSLLKSAKKINDNKYMTRFNNTTFFIIMDKLKIKSILYKDAFDNKVKIDFTNQVEDKKIGVKLFTPIIPDDYDIIRN